MAKTPGAKGATPKAPKTVGRKIEYRPEYDARAHKFSLLGMTDAQIAGALEIGETTLHRWMQAHPTLRTSIMEGRVDADGNVVRSLYQKAQGYDFEEEHISSSGGKVFKSKVKRRAHADVTAQIFWLCNRQRNLWKRGSVDPDSDAGVALAAFREAIGALAPKPPKPDSEST